MTLSFCIITNGKRDRLMGTVIRAIKAQEIPRYEIIVAGVFRDEPGIVYLPAADAANNGRLGEMRNLAVARASGENIVMLDDDIILSPDWYRNFTAYAHPFDILTSQIRLPDGGRYYDHATVGGPKGLTFLDPDQDDDHVFMTGGGGWVMKNRVASSVAWDPQRAFYQEEDVDFSRRCQAKGFKISHNHAMVVYHADPSYTNIGKALRRRGEGRSQLWVLRELDGLTAPGIVKKIIQLRRGGQRTEAADVIRMAIRQGKSAWLFKLMWQALLSQSGGELPDTSWSPTGSDDYLETLKAYGESER
jgi:hypothetical protein